LLVLVLGLLVLAAGSWWRVTAMRHQEGGLPAPTGGVPVRPPAGGDHLRSVALLVLPAGVPAPDLPPISVPLGPALRVVADRELPELDRLRPLVDGTLAVVTEPQDLLALRRILRDPAEGDTLRNECANALYRNEAPELAADLGAVLADRRNGARFRSFAAQHLGVLFEADPGRAELRAELLACLEDDEVVLRREALWPLCRQGDALALARAEAWLQDPAAVGIHDLCCRIAAEIGRRDWVPRIRSLAANADPVIASAARQALATLETAP
jgi:hypothetical protein